ncbi:MAG: GNAT family N-acetyltransferase [Parachlamydiaceae bacterium]|nr:GNAT family N-acetyltransferase [Parachlamydiaceae bacterium]
MESLEEINQLLKELDLTLKPFYKDAENDLYEIYKEVIETGAQFPTECHSKEEFYRTFLFLNEHVYVCYSTLLNKVIGGFYIKSNFPGRSNHIANAGYMVKSTVRNRGIGKLLVKASLQIAKNLGFKAMQYNMVLSQNTIAVKLYEKLGFNIAGVIPEAVRNPNGLYQDGYIMHRMLDPSTGTT